MSCRRFHFSFSRYYFFFRYSYFIFFLFFYVPFTFTFNSYLPGFQSQWSSKYSGSYCQRFSKTHVGLKNSLVVNIGQPRSLWFLFSQVLKVKDRQKFTSPHISGPQSLWLLRSVDLKIFGLEIFTGPPCQWFSESLALKKSLVLKDSVVLKVTGS